MSTRMAPKILVPLLFSLASGLAGAACVPVVGTVKLLPDLACNISKPGVAPALTAGQFSAQPGECFTVQLSLAGFPTATGYAGLTNEPVVGLTPLGGSTVTPAMIPDGATPVPRQIIQTARTVVSLGSGARRTTLYSSDVIVMQPQFTPTGQMIPKTMTEQILITGTDNQGAYAKASGHLAVLGNSLGQLAPVAGQICLP